MKARTNAHQDNWHHEPVAYGEPSLDLTDQEQGLLAGAGGPALALAMTLICRMAELVGAPRLIPISGAHIDSCLYHGGVGLDFAERLASGGGQVAVPTTLNVSALDLLHPDLVQLDDATRARARRLTDAYLAMDCQPTFTCAPYQLPSRPAFGEHVAWAESNAIVFANSVLGARTGRYGDFIDICAALTGRVPLAGLHLDGERRARIVFHLGGDVARAASDEFFGVLGHLLGRRAGSQVPAIVGLPATTTEDQLKQIGAAAASSGSVGMFHAVGITPEAPTLADACGGQPPDTEIEVTSAMLAEAWQELSRWDGASPLAAVSVGTPHFSAAEFDSLAGLLAGRRIHRGIEMYASTGRDVLAAIESAGVGATIRDAGVRIVVDTCTYITPVLHAQRGATVMTNSAKWAWYGPGNLGVQVVYGSLADCVESAVAGKVVRERPAYLDG